MKWSIQLTGKEETIETNVLAHPRHTGLYTVHVRQQTYVVYWNSVLSTFQIKTQASKSPQGASSADSLSTPAHEELRLPSTAVENSQAIGIDGKKSFVLETCYHVRSKTFKLSQQQKKTDLEFSHAGGLSYIRANITPISVSRLTKSKVVNNKTSKFFSPITGKVLKVLRQHGHTIHEGEVILIIEAMKMENKICADGSGILSGLDIKEGDHVNLGDELFTVDFQSSNTPPPQSLHK